MPEAIKDSVQNLDISDVKNPPEIKKDEINPNDDYKRDMFKFKNQARDAQKDKEELQAKIDAYDLAEKERQGKHVEVIDDLKEQLKSERGINKSNDLKYAKAKVRASIVSKLKDNGCKDAEAFVKLMGDDYMETVSIDKETFEPIGEDVSLVIENSMKKYEHLGLFGKKVNIADRSPNNTPLNTPTKPHSAKTQAELESELITKFG